MYSNQPFYHPDCYSSLCNTTKLERAEKRYKNALEKSNATLIVPKIGRPSTSATSSASNNNNNDNNLISTSSNNVLRSSGTLFNSDLCIICQKPEGKLRTVALLQTGKNMLDVASRLIDTSFFIRLNSINAADDAIANDAKYHLKCWVVKQGICNFRSRTARNRKA